MRLRQKLFTAILAAMVLMFLLLSLASFLNALEAQGARRSLEERLEATAVRMFARAARSDAEDRWLRLIGELDPLGSTADWEVTEEGRPLLDASREDLSYMIEVAREGPYELLRAREVAGLEPVRWLSTIFWALAAGTVMLLLVVYGLLLRLILRPVEDLLAASHALSSGGRPPRVAGDTRRDEMGSLIRAFNRMANEVVISREDLKRRIEEATQEREKALKRLALEQRLSATGKLAAGIAHEINNPLGGMINAARTLAKEPNLSPRASEYVGLVAGGLDRIARLVERMQSFVRAKAHVGPVDLADTIGKALSFARHRIDKESVEVVREFDEACPTVSGDAGELQQVFLNLVLNALDSMLQAQKRELRVSVVRAEGKAVATIADTGSGMDEEQLANAFDLFYSTKESGTGLGLAIAHKIIADHGGDIELTSVVGAGTTARIALPLAGSGS